MNEMNTNKTEPVKRDTYVGLFNGMMKMAREAGALTEFDKIADYAMCDYYEDAAKKPISSYEFKTSFVVDYGGSEGIYIDGYLDGTLDEIGEYQHRHFCTLKTLNRDFEAMKLMGSVCGILQYYATEYINRNLDRYEPDPAKISAFHQKHVPYFCVHCGNSGHVNVETLPYKNGSIQKELYAFRCDICGAQTVFCETTLDLRKNYWDKGIYSIKNSETLSGKGSVLSRQSGGYYPCRLSIAANRGGNRRPDLAYRTDVFPDCRLPESGWKTVFR